MNTPRPHVRIIHETNPTKYFPALSELADDQRISIVGRHRYSVAKEWLRSWLRERKPLRSRTATSLSDFLLRLKLLAIQGEVVILAFAPWDWRMLIYAVLARKNAIIYQTSWPYWEQQRTPRQYGPLTPLLRRFWLFFLRLPNVHVVAILDATRVELRDRFGISAEVIPHAVPEVFFTARRMPRTDPLEPLRLIYVGELSRKKGIEQLFQLMESLVDERAVLTLVGDGPLRERCIEAATKNPAIRCVGPVHDRAEMAKTMAAHDLLVVLSQRDRTWEELFGIVIAEAMAAGLGVIASDHIGPRSLLGAADLGNLFADNDLDGAIRLIRKLASDRDELDQFRSGHLNLADAFQLSNVADRWARTIAPLADEAGQFRRGS